jgi:thymidylate synthase ThyX
MEVVGVNKQVMKNFSFEEQEKIRAYLFTNPNGDVGFIYPDQPLIVGEELPPLVSAYSRSSQTFQDRVLMFLDIEKKEAVKQFMPAMEQLTQVFRNPDGTLAVSRKTQSFTEEWVLGHGHSSIKEESNFVGHVEYISDIAAKKITGHPLMRPQVRSTRYLYQDAHSQALAMQDEDLLSLPNKDEVLEYVDNMNRRYAEITNLLTDRTLDTNYTRDSIKYLTRPEQVKKEMQKWAENQKRIDTSFEATPDKMQKQEAKYIAGFEGDALKKQIQNFVLDSSRAYLLGNNRTSFGFSGDARSLESVLTTLLSSQRTEDKKKGVELLTQAKKISPVLMGEKSHATIDAWQVSNETEFRNYIEDKFSHLPVMKYNDNKVDLISTQDMNMSSDRFNAAVIAFNYTDLPLRLLYNNISNFDAEEIIERAHARKAKRDVIHSALKHNGLSVEMVSGFHAYRDLYRHRKGGRSVQLLTTRLGFEMPEIMTSFNLGGLYEEDMDKASKIYEKVRLHDKHIAEKVVPFGAFCRALHTWAPEQIGYVVDLRGRITTGNRTYVQVAKMLGEQLKELMPATGQNLTIDNREYPAELWKKGYGWYDATQR